MDEQYCIAALLQGWDVWMTKKKKKKNSCKMQIISRGRIININVLHINTGTWDVFAEKCRKKCPNYRKYRRV